MSKSQTALDSALRYASHKLETARSMSSTIKNGILATATTIAIALPFAGSEDTPLPIDAPVDTALIGQPPNITNITNNQSAVLPGTENDIRDPTSFTHVINIDPQLRIISAPPSARTWHRAAFTSIGDSFWALPDASFTLTLAEPTSPACVGTRCTATFALTSEKFAAANANAAFTIDGKSITNTIVACNQTLEAGRSDYTNVTTCNLVIEGDGLCIQLRRSETKEQPTERVALDIKWFKFDSRQSAGQQCPP